MVIMLGLDESLDKLLIKAYTDKEFKYFQKHFEVDFNPETYSKSYEVMSYSKKGIGQSGYELDFERMKPQVLRFEFIIDGSGALDKFQIGLFRKKLNVEDRINDFLDTVYKYEGELHRPKWLQLIWGSEIFKCVIEKVDIEYTLFNPDGSPLRAIIKASFIENISDTYRAARDKTSSPDLTHQRVVYKGDNLVSLTYRIYETFAPLVQVARANDLDRTGMKLLFPPLTT